jgi:hypothetical protein
VTLLCPGAETGAPAACLAYASVFRSVAYPLRWVAPERWSGVRGEVVVVPGAEAGRLSDEVRDRLVAFVEAGGNLVTALDTPLARALGLRFAPAAIEVAGVSEVTAPGLLILWKAPVAVRRFEAPAGAKVFASARVDGVPLLASFRRGLGTVLFLGVELDEENALGTSRFPYFLQAVGSAFGVAPALASPHVVAYADLGDHDDQEPEAIAGDWWRRGIREVHLGTWHAWGKKRGLYGPLVEACHRRGILVYAWFELPHVAREFWDAHPEWRERTATGADAHVDWRRLMALTIPECFDAAAREVVGLLQRFDWDGADLAEVYFESPLGLARPDQFTPMNRAVREEFRRRAGFDPEELFDEGSPRFFKRDPTSLASFMAYRRDKTVELHERLLGVLAGVRTVKPALDVVVTLVDAFYDRTMRDSIAVDTPRVAALAQKVPFELQIEDPFTLWALGPERYARMAADYGQLLPPSQRLAVDVNVVPRANDVRPTVQQTGLELYRLVAEARRAFPKVCLYSEASVYRQDWALLPGALAATAHVEPSGANAAAVESDGTVELSTGAPSVEVWLDGREWPGVRGGVALLPRGRHTVEWKARGGRADGIHLVGLTGTLLDAAAENGVVSVRYSSSARGFVVLSVAPARAEVDGTPVHLVVARSEGGFVLGLPPGEHTVRLTP